VSVTVTKEIIMNKLALLFAVIWTFFWTLLYVVGNLVLGNPWDELNMSAAVVGVGLASYFGFKSGRGDKKS